MAYAFIMEHDYNDSRKAVLVTISYDEEVPDYSLGTIAAFPTPTKTVTYTRRIICLADTSTDSIITFNYEKIITDARPYYTAIIGWGPDIEKQQ